MVGDEKIVTNFFGEVRQGVVVGGEIFPLLLKNNFWNYNRVNFDKSNEPQLFTKLCPRLCDFIYQLSRYIYFWEIFMY